MLLIPSEFRLEFLQSEARNLLPNHKSRSLALVGMTLSRPLKSYTYCRMLGVGARMNRMRNLKSKIQNPKCHWSPTPDDFRPAEWAIISKCHTPRQVQELLRSLPYNWERKGETLRTFRGVVHHGSAHCLEAALAAATILEQHGFPPLLLDLESQDNLDHVLFLFRWRGRWGTVARSRDYGLHGRKPVFRTVRQLVMSYVDPYVDNTARITGYGVGDLRPLVKCNWRLSTRNVWEVERALINMPHKKLKSSDRRYELALRRFLAFRERFPHGPVTFYSNQHLWL